VTVNWPFQLMMEMTRELIGSSMMAAVLTAGEPVVNWWPKRRASNCHYDVN